MAQARVLTERQLKSLAVLRSAQTPISRQPLLTGQARAKQNGLTLGRPSKMNNGMKSAVKLLREKGMGTKQIAKELQIGVGTVYSII